MVEKNFIVPCYTFDILQVLMKPALIIFISKHWDALLASITIGVFLYFFTRHSGIGISPDSVVYESTATNIRHHFSFTDFNGLPLVDFPLGYPSFLAFTMLLTGLPVLSIAPFINCLLFSGSLLLTSIIISGHQKRSSIYKICFLAALACSPCLLEVYSMLWSETLFIFLILLFIVALRNYQVSHSCSRLLLAALVATLAFVTRYAGIGLFFTGGTLLFFDGDLSVSKKIKHLLLFGCMGSSFAVINLVRNRLVSGNITGVREKAIHSVGQNLHQIGTVLSDWLPFMKGHETMATVLFILILLSGIGKFCYRILQQQYFYSYETITTCFFVVYALFIITIASISRFEDLSSRLLSPVYIPLLLVGSSWIVPVLQQSLHHKKNIVLIALILFYAGFHYNQYQLNAEAWEGIKDAGIPGYAEDSWTQSPAIAFIKKNKNHFVQPVYADANDAVYFLTGIHALPLPHKEIPKEISVFLQQPAFHLIWLTDGENADLVGLDFIKQYKKQVSVQQLDSGRIYFFSDSASHK